MNYFIFLSFLLVPVSVVFAFSDVDSGDPYAVAIEYVKDKGIVEGYPDGTFQSERSINRVEFLKILSGLNPDFDTCDTPPNYLDVDWQSWYGPFLNWASCEGLVSGYPDGRFQPANSINYAEAAKIVFKSHQKSFEALAGNQCESLTSSTWYEAFTCALDVLNIKPDQNIEPSQALTRGQMAEMIYRSDQLLSTNLTLQNPNILLIIADDFGHDAAPWSDLGTGQKPSMPHLSELASQGRIYTNVWSNPVCSPTRAGILTGKYGVHTGVLGPVMSSDDGIRTTETSLQSFISQNSTTPYAQAIIGKWHLSTAQNGNHENPALMGVPYYSGLIGGGVKTYEDWTKVTQGQASRAEAYITTDFTDEAIDWIDDQSKPWFLWLAYTAPHTPFHLPPENLISDQNLNGNDIEENPLPYYLAALEALDSEIGRMLGSLTSEEKANTIIIFMGDNGTPSQVAQAPYTNRTVKGTLNQGGINVPFFVHGPGVMPGKTQALVNTTDLFATIAQLAGAKIQTYENSISLVSTFDGQETPRDWAYSEIKTTSKNGEPSRNNGWTIRDQQYKLIVLDSGRLSLYDLQNDPFEQNNLARDNDYQIILNRLKALGDQVRSS